VHTPALSTNRGAARAPAPATGHGKAFCSVRPLAPSHARRHGTGTGTLHSPFEAGAALWRLVLLPTQTLRCWHGAACVQAPSSRGMAPDAQTPTVKAALPVFIFTARATGSRDRRQCATECRRSLDHRAHRTRSKVRHPTVKSTRTCDGRTWTLQCMHE
jgi:hypothetical protein